MPDVDLKVDLVGYAVGATAFWGIIFASAVGWLPQLNRDANGFAASDTRAHARWTLARTGGQAPGSSAHGIVTLTGVGRSVQ
jgi:hypothetical protein